ALLELDSLAVALLPPLMFHLVLEAGGNGSPAARAWRWLLAAFYASCIAVGLARVLQAIGLFSGPWTDNLNRAPAVALALAAAMGLLFQIVTRRPPRPAQ